MRRSSFDSTRAVQVACHSRCKFAVALCPDSTRSIKGKYQFLLSISSPSGAWASLPSGSYRRCPSATRPRQNLGSCCHRHRNIRAFPKIDQQLASPCHPATDRRPRPLPSHRRPPDPPEGSPHACERPPARASGHARKLEEEPRLFQLKGLFEYAPDTRLLLFSSLLILSRPFVVRIFLQCDRGNDL